MVQVIMEKTKVKTLIDPHSCKKCGICVGLCPQNVFKINERGEVMVAQLERCKACGICESLCPDYAVMVEVNR